MDARADEKLVEDWLARAGLRAERFSKEEMERSKTPEFRVFRGGEFAFLCEVKSMAKDERLDKALAAEPPGTVVEVSGPDPTFNSVANKIHEAVAQFDAVNPDLAHANVLVLVNHDPIRDVLDLHAVAEGGLPTDSGGWLPIYRAYSDGRIRQEKSRIAVYVWIERESGEVSVRPYEGVCNRYPVLADLLPKLRQTTV
jgi:hypothetical protein